MPQFSHLNAGNYAILAVNALIPFFRVNDVNAAFFSMNAIKGAFCRQTQVKPQLLR